MTLATRTVELALWAGLLGSLLGCRQVPETGTANAPASDPSQQLPWTSLLDGKTLEGWTITAFGGQDQVSVEDGRVVMQMGYPLTGITYEGSIPSVDYELALQAQRIEGNDFFCCVTFPVREQLCSFVVGGWAGSVTGISCIDMQDASENETTLYRHYDNKRWYAIRIQVTDERIICKIDGVEVVDLQYSGKKLSLRPEVEPSKPFGICCFESVAALRDVRIRRTSPGQSERLP